MTTDPDGQLSGQELIDDLKARLALSLQAMMQSYSSDASASDDDQAQAIRSHITQSPEWPAIEATLLRLQKQGYHEQPKSQELHRAIGGYIDTFSTLTAIMRNAITSYIATPVDVDPHRLDPLLDVLFATMTAKPMVESFFGLSTHVGELDEGEIAVRNALRRFVDDHVSFRNDLVHADWSIGWANAGTSEPIPDTAYKIKTKAGVPTRSDLGITTQDIIDRINDLQRLYRLVQVFAAGCLRRQRGKGRVSDVLEAAPASSMGGTVIRLKRH